MSETTDPTTTSPVPDPDMCFAYFSLGVEVAKHFLGRKGDTIKECAQTIGEIADGELTLFDSDAEMRSCLSPEDGAMWTDLHEILRRCRNEEQQLAGVIRWWFAAQKEQASRPGPSS